MPARATARSWCARGSCRQRLHLTSSPHLPPSLPRLTLPARHTPTRLYLHMCLYRCMPMESPSRAPVPCIGSVRQVAHSWISRARPRATAAPCLQGLAQLAAQPYTCGIPHGTDLSLPWVLQVIYSCNPAHSSDTMTGVNVTSTVADCQRLQRLSHSSLLPVLAWASTTHPTWLCFGADTCDYTIYISTLRVW